MTMAPDNLDNRLVLNHEYGERSFPHEEWRWLRANEPVHMTDAENVQPFWAITKHLGGKRASMPRCPVEKICRACMTISA